MVLFYASRHDGDNPQFYFIPTLCWQSIFNRGKRVLSNLSIKFCDFEFGIHLVSEAKFCEDSKEAISDVTKRVMETIDKIDEQ